MDDDDKKDAYEERAAIYEFDAGMRRGAAEAKAWKDVYETTSHTVRRPHETASSGA